MASSDPFGLARLNFRRGYRHSSSRQPAPGIEEATAVWRSDKVLGSRTFWIVWREKEERMGKSRVAKVISKSQSGTQELKTLVNVREVCSPHYLLAVFSINCSHIDLSTPIISSNSSPCSKTRIRSVSQLPTAICPNISPCIQNKRKRTLQSLRNKF